MGTAVISSSDLFRRRDFSPRRKVLAPRTAEFAGQFASLGHLNTQLQERRKILRNKAITRMFTGTTIPVPKRGRR
jgi:hypothetical protein